MLATTPGRTLFRLAKSLLSTVGSHHAATCLPCQCQRYAVLVDTMLGRAYIRKCLPQEVRKDFIRPLRTLYKAPTRLLRSLKNPYKAFRFFFAQALNRLTICTVDVCSETLSLTILPSVLVRKASIGNRPWDSKECEASMCSETLSLTVLPSELARREASGSRPWSSANVLCEWVCSRRAVYLVVESSTTQI